MGVIIYTDDDARFKTGDYVVMHGALTSAPTAHNVTYILHNYNFTEEDVLYWHPTIHYRMVVVVDKIPKLTDASKHCVIVDQSLKAARSKINYGRLMKGVVGWNDRDRAFRLMQQVPIPLANVFIKANTNDIDIGRLIAKARYTLPEQYIRAIIAFGLTPNKGFNYPSKQSKDNGYKVPSSIRKSDKHWGTILSNDSLVTNEVRTNEPESLPQSVRKTKEVVTEWL